MSEKKKTDNKKIKENSTADTKETSANKVKETSAMKTKTSDSCSCIHSSCFKNSLLLLIALICCVATISHVKKNKTEKLNNTSIENTRLSNFKIFEDINVKVYDDDFSHDAIRDKKFENGTAEFLKKVVRTGDTIVEIDQNIGAQALLIAKLTGLSGRIYYFNPYKKYVEALEESAKLNDMQDRIIASPLAISAENSDGLLIYKNNFPIISGKVCKKTDSIPSGCSAMAIKISSIDSQLPAVQNIDILKINVNGNESDVLLGSMNLIKKSNNIRILCSYQNDSFGDTTVLDTLVAEGFSVYTIENNGDLKPVAFKALDASQKYTLLLQKQNITNKADISDLAPAATTPAENTASMQAPNTEFGKNS